MLGDQEQSIDETLSLKLSIEPTEITKLSLSELSNIADDILESIARSAEAYKTVRQQGKDIHAHIEELRSKALREDVLSPKTSTIEMPQLNLDSSVTQESINMGVTPSDIFGSVFESATPGNEAALFSAANEVSLSTRGMDSSPSSVAAVNAMGGIEASMPSQIAKENGSMFEQLTESVSRIGSDAKDFESNEARLPRVFDNADNDILEKLSEIAENTKHLSDDSKEKKEKAEITPEAKQEKPPETPPIKQRTDEELDLEDKGTMSEKLAKLFESRESQNLQRGIADFGGKIEGYGNNIEEFADIFSSAGSYLDSDSSSDGSGPGGLMTSLGLARAGSKMRGFTGLGQAGARVASIGGNIAGMATKAILPIAIATAGYSAIDRGSKFYRGQQESTRPEGYTGFDAFTRGVGYNISDRWRGLNPFDASSKDDYAQYRAIARESGYQWESGSDEWEAMEDAARAFRERGMNPQNAQIYAQAIDEDSSFDVNEALDSMAEAAREANVSLSTFSETATSVKMHLERVYGTDPEEADKISEELTSALYGEDSIFEKSDGMFGYATKDQMNAFTQSTFQARTTQGNIAWSILSQDEEFMSEIEEAGIESSDQASVLGYAYENLTSEEKVALLEDVALYGVSDTMSPGHQQQIIESTTGITPTLDRIPEDTSSRFTRGTTGRFSDFGENVVKVLIEAAPGFSAIATAVQDREAALRGDIAYEDQQQSGNYGQFTPRPLGTGGG